MALQVQFWTISGLSVELRMNIRTDPCNKVISGDQRSDPSYDLTYSPAA